MPCLIPRPPSCQCCAQTPAAFFTLVAGGKAETYACCQGCPALLDGAILPSCALGLKLTVPTPVGRGKCPACGFRWADFDRLHRLGCPTCYEAHAPQALTTIARLQPGLEHQGRRPFDPVADREARLTKARASLKEALKTEDYEAAAALRDLILSLESGQSESRT
ncbi:MAG: UvrB/UvrC motif-containing protein [Verrucomicrobiota bacterium]